MKAMAATPAGFPTDLPCLTAALHNPKNPTKYTSFQELTFPGWRLPECPDSQDPHLRQRT
jgi:hypothetical protein